MPVLLAICVLVLLAVIGAGFYLDEPFIGFAVAGLIAAVLAFPALSYADAHYNERTLTCTVTDKDRGGSNGSYRIYTDNCGQLENTDSMWRGKWDSADVWQKIKPGQTYRLTIAGWRAPLFSGFPNVLKVEPPR